MPVTAPQVESTVRLHADDDPISSAIQELLEQVPQLPMEVRQRVLHRLDSLMQLVRVDLDGAAAPGALDVGVVLQPSDGLLELLAAVRAFGCLSLCENQGEIL